MTEKEYLSSGLQVELLASQVGKSSDDIKADADNLKLYWDDAFADPFDKLNSLLGMVGKEKLIKLQSQIAHIGNLSISNEFAEEVDYEDQMIQLGTMCGAYELGHSAEEVQSAVRQLFPFQNIGNQKRL